MKKGRKGAEFSGQSKAMVAKEILRAWGSVAVNIPNLLKKRQAIQKNKESRRPRNCGLVSEIWREIFKNFLKHMKTKKIVVGFSAILISFTFFSCVRAETLKIGFVTDWESGSQKKYDHKLPSKAASYLKSAVNHYNKIFHPDLVVGGGDYILNRGVNSKKAIKQMKTINNTFKKASASRSCIASAIMI